ncbi:MAG TPA: HK97 family phage prohead protease, partial [Xylella taiwanensis]
MKTTEQLLQDIRDRGGMRRQVEVMSVNAEARTVELAFSSEAAEVPTWWGLEVLGHGPGEVRMQRLNDGAALLMDHNHRDQIGVIESASIDSDQRGRAVVRFGRSERAEEIFRDVIDGIRKHVSVGYFAHAMELIEKRGDEPVYRVTDWEPFEISIVGVPADPSVGVGRSLEKP